ASATILAKSSRMNCPPHRHQPLPLALRLPHHTAQIAAADPADPIDRDTARCLQNDLRFAALTEHVHMGRVVIIRKNHEPEAVRAVHRHHEANPSMLGFQDVDERRHARPRVSAMISSVVRPLVVVPRIRSNLLGRTRPLPILRRNARPSSAISKSTLLPGLMPRRSRTGFGIVTCPLRVTVTLTGASVILPTLWVLPRGTRWCQSPARATRHRAVGWVSA